MFILLFLLGLSIILQSLYLAQYLDKATNLLLLIRYLSAAIIGGITCWVAVKQRWDYDFVLAVIAVFLSLTPGVIYRWKRIGSPI